MNEDVDWKLVRCVARNLRAEMEDFACATHLGDDDLGGYCGIASYVLSRVLRAFGVRTEIRYNTHHHDGHCWLVIAGTDVVVDVTATQFQNRESDVDYLYCIPKVLIASEGEFDWIYSPQKSRRTGASAARFLREWDDQSPHWYRPQLRKMYRRVVAKQLKRKKLAA